MAFVTDTDLAATGTGQGANMVGFIQDDTSAVARSTMHKLRDIVSVKDFGAKGDGVTDDTAAFNAFFAALAADAGSSGVIPGGMYSVTSILLANANGTYVDWQGQIVGSASGTYDSVLTIKNSSDVVISGKVALSGHYNPDYACGIAIYSDNDCRSASNIEIYNPTIAAVRLAMRFSRPSEPHALVSEISVFGGHTYHCPSVVEAYGTQTVVNFSGCNLMSGTDDQNPTWKALPQYTVRTFGAAVLISGGEVLHVLEENNGALLTVEPIDDTGVLGYGKPYGKIFVRGATMESAAHLLIAQNSGNVTTPDAGSGIVTIQSCFGFHSQDLFPFVELESSFTGKVTIGGGTSFYAKLSTGLPRTKYNVVAHGDADLFIDDDAFGTNFLQGLGGISGGIAHFSHREILFASNCNAQNLNPGVPTTLKWNSVAPGPDRDRFTSAYSSSTGMFHVPPGGLKSADLFVQVRTNKPTEPLGIDVYANGGFVCALPLMIGGAGNTGIASGTLHLGDLDAGSDVYVQATNLGTGAATNMGSSEKMAISARR